MLTLLAGGAPSCSPSDQLGIYPPGTAGNQQHIKLIFEIREAASQLTALVNNSFIILALFRPLLHFLRLQTGKRNHFSVYFIKSLHSHSSKQKKLTHIRRLSVSAVWLSSICSFLTLNKIFSTCRQSSSVLFLCIWPHLRSEGSRLTTNT